MSFKALKFVGLLFIVMLAVVVPLHAATGGTISISDAPTGQTPGDCNSVEIEYHYALTANTDDDGSGNDCCDDQREDA